MIIDKKKNKLPEYLDAIKKEFNDMDIDEWKQKRKDNLKEQFYKRKMKLNDSITEKLKWSNYENFK